MISLTYSKNNIEAIFTENTFNAIDAVNKAENSLEAFVALENWMHGKTAKSLRIHETEKQIETAGNEVLRMLLQEYLDQHEKRDVGKAIVQQIEENDTVKLMHMREKRKHSRQYESIFGTVRIKRIGYYQKGCNKSIHPLDKELNIPRRKYSHYLEKRGIKHVIQGSYEQSLENIHDTTPANIPKRQLEQLSKESAVDFESFYQKRQKEAFQSKDTGEIVVGGVDCKGIPRRKTKVEKEEPRKIRLKKGEKHQKKKMSTVGSVHTQKPHIRSKEEIVEHLMDIEPSKKASSRPRAENRRLWASVIRSKSDVIKEIYNEMKNRNKKGDKIMVCLSDGERALHKRMLKYLPNVILILDIIHVLEYLWEAAYVFYEEGSSDARLFVRKRLLGILGGKVRYVAAGIRQSATKRYLKGKRLKTIDKICKYFLKNKSRMQYNEYLDKGLPIASGNVEGACGHLVKDRMELTGASWSLEGAEAVLKLRAIAKSGDFEDYWNFHLNQECLRNYPEAWSIAP